MAEQDFDAASVDRAFAELVAGWHLTAERPTEPRPLAEPSATELTTSERTTGEAAELEPTDRAAEEPPGERITSIVLPPSVRVVPLRAPGPRDHEVRPSEADDEPYVPSPLPPLSRPGAPAMVGWAGVLFAAVVVLAAGFGLVLPAWIGWTAVTCFIVGSVVLLTQLPRHRPPDAGDGAVL